MNDQIPNPVGAHAAAAVPEPGPAPAKRRGSWAGVLTIVIGSLVLLTLLVGGIWSGVMRSSTAPFDVEYSARVSEQVSLRLDVGEIDVVFDRSDDTAAFVGSGRWAAGKQPLSMTNDADGALVIESTRSFTWFGADQRELHGTLHLPRSLDGSVELDVDLAVGALTVDGDLARLGADVDVGDLTVTGRVEAGAIAVSVGRATLMSGGGVIEARTETGEVRLLGDFDELRADAELGQVTIDGTVRDRLDVSVAAGAAGVTLHEALPERASLSADLGSISLTLPDEPLRLDASSSIRDAARSAGLDIDGDAGAPEFTITTDLGNVRFSVQ